MERNTELKVKALATAIDNFLANGTSDDYENATMLSELLLEIINAVEKGGCKNG